MRYVTAGCAAGLLCFGCLMLSQYKKSLEESLSKFSNITIKTVKMKNTVEDMRKAISSINAIYPAIASRTSKEALLHTADTVKLLFKGSQITLKDMAKDGSELMLPLEIKMDGVRYSDIVACIGSLQSFTLPHVTIQALSVEKMPDDSAPDRMMCTMEVCVRIPDDGKGTADIGAGS